MSSIEVLMRWKRRKTLSFFFTIKLSLKTFFSLLKDLKLIISWEKKISHLLQIILSVNECFWYEINFLEPSSLQERREGKKWKISKLLKSQISTQHEINWISFSNFDKYHQKKKKKKSFIDIANNQKERKERKVNIKVKHKNLWWVELFDELYFSIWKKFYFHILQ